MHRIGLDGVAELEAEMRRSGLIRDVMGEAGDATTATVGEFFRRLNEDGRQKFGNGSETLEFYRQGIKRLNYVTIHTSLKNVKFKNDKVLKYIT